MCEWDKIEPLPWGGVEKQAAFNVGYQIGLEAALAALDADGLPQLNGVKVARLAIQEVHQETRMRNYVRAFKVAAKAGVDMDVHEIAIRSDGILLRPLDLAERAA
jgi:hypothetical protein